MNSVIQMFSKHHEYPKSKCFNKLCRYIDRRFDAKIFPQIEYQPLSVVRDTKWIERLTETGTWNCWCFLISCDGFFALFTISIIGAHFALLFDPFILNISNVLSWNKKSCLKSPPDSTAMHHPSIDRMRTDIHRLCWCSTVDSLDWRHRSYRVLNQCGKCNPNKPKFSLLNCCYPTSTYRFEYGCWISWTPNSSRLITTDITCFHHDIIKDFELKNG